MIQTPAAFKAEIATWDRVYAKARAGAVAALDWPILAFCAGLAAEHGCQQETKALFGLIEMVQDGQDAPQIVTAMDALNTPVRRCLEEVFAEKEGQFVPPSWGQGDTQTSH